MVYEFLIFTFAALTPTPLSLREQCLSQRGRGCRRSRQIWAEDLALQFVGNDVVVGIDADVAGDFQAFAGDGERVHFGVVIEGARGR